VAKTEYEVLTSSRFYLEIRLRGSDDRMDAYFMECQGFECKQEVIEVCHVTPQKWGSKGTAAGRIVQTKVPGGANSGNITLRRGLTVSSVMWDWFAQVDQGNWAKQRRDGDVTLYDQGAVERARFRFIGAFPVRYKISDLSAQNSEFEIEELELAIDEFRRVDKK
jgi:phage tail-like protein